MNSATGNNLPEIQNCPPPPKKKTAIKEEHSGRVMGILKIIDGVGIKDCQDILRAAGEVVGNQSTWLYDDAVSSKEGIKIRINDIT